MGRMTARWRSLGVVAGAAVAVTSVVAVSSTARAGSGTPSPSANGATTVAGTGTPGFGGDGGPADAAALDAPSGLAVDRAGDLFVADTGNCRVREVVARGGQAFGRTSHPGTIVTVAGGPCASSANPPPTALAVDGVGDLFIAYPTANRVAVLGPRSATVLGNPVTADRVTTVAGDGLAGDAGDGGPATRASLDLPSGLATDAGGDLFVADTANCRVRAVAASANGVDGQPLAAGQIGTVAGTGVCGSAGDGGPATAAQVWDPGALATDALGNLYVADQGNRTVRVLSPQSTTVLGAPVGAGDLTTVAGEGSYGPYLSDGFAANGQTGELNFPDGLAVDPAGNLYVADGLSHVIREVTAEAGRFKGQAVAAGALVTVAGATSTDVRRVTTTWVRTTMQDPTGVVVKADGTVVYADHGADVVRSLAPRS